MEVSGQFHALALRYLWCPPERRLGNPQSQFGHSGKDKKIPAPARNQTPVIQPVA
jgi:hypothetical protein